MKKFSMNVEIVDPQLKNNQDLVSQLMLYEKYWERGKHYFLNGKRCAQLIHFSNTLEGLCEKYEKFKELIEYRDADIFMMIPMIMILKSIEKNDKGICEYFLPEIKQTETKLGQMYEYVSQNLYESNSMIINNKAHAKNNRERSIGRSIRFSRKKPNGKPEPAWKTRDLSRSLHMGKSRDTISRYKTILRNKKQYTANKLTKERMEVVDKVPARTKFNYKLYNVIEKQILSIDLSQKEQELYEASRGFLDGAIHKIKILSVNLERKEPMEWNTFLDVALEG